MSAVTLHTETHVLHLVSANQDKRTYAKRYSPRPGNDPSPVQGPSESGTPITLIFLHGLATHKETWEPTISHLFELDRRSRPGIHARSGGTPTILEAWTIDSPDHGESACLNRNSLDTDYPLRVECPTYGRIVLTLLQSGLLRAPDSKLVLVGHSAGTISLVLGVGDVLESTLPTLAAMVLVEPWMALPDISDDPHMQKLAAEMSRASVSRSDVWSSREEAHLYFTSKDSYQNWDQRALRLFVDHALRPLPTPEHPSGESGVALAFPKKLESVAYKEFHEGRAALKVLPRISQATPVHLIFGAHQPRIVKKMQRAVCDNAGKVASITHLPGVGHPVPQQTPEPLAKAVWDAILSSVLTGARGRILQEKL